VKGVPALLIIAQLEAAVRVVVGCINEGERIRLESWLENTRPEWRELIQRAIALAEEEREG
jgi:hypothetical protein